MVERVADAAAVPFIGLWLAAPDQMMIERLQQRQHDASDADTVVLRLQQTQNSGDIAWNILDASPSADVVLHHAQASLYAHLNDAASD